MSVAKSAGIAICMFLWFTAWVLSAAVFNNTVAFFLILAAAPCILIYFALRMQ